MKIGLNYAPIRRNDQPRAAILADRLGYSSLWYGEHVALPHDFDPSKWIVCPAKIVPDGTVSTADLPGEDRPRRNGEHGRGERHRQGVRRPDRACQRREYRYTPRTCHGSHET